MVNWIGGGGTLWITGGNWAGGSVPLSYQSAEITQSGTAPVLVVIGAGDSVSANPLTVGAAGSAEAVTLVNDGSFSNYAGVTLYAGTTLDNAGSMTWSTGGYDAGLIEDTGSFTATGNVTVAASGSLDVAAGGSASISNTLTVDGVLSVEGNLSIASAIAGGGSVIVDGGALAGGGKSSALALGGSTLAFVVENGGSLHVTAPAPGTSFSLAGTGNTLDIAQYSGTISAPVTGLALGDSITVGRSGSGTLTSNGDGTYSVTMGGVTLTDVSLAPGLGGGVFQNGTLVACYLRGTRLATPRGDVAVEALREGDTLLTASGQAVPIRWIGRRRHAAEVAAATPSVWPVLLRAGSLGPGVPRRDLRVSPRHAMFIEGVLVPAMLLVNGVSIVQEKPRGEVLYFHVELERHEIVLAEGAPAESFRDEDSRPMFDNAGEWHGRGAGGAARARKVEDGSRLEALRRRIEARAGIARGEPGPGELIGHLDACELEGVPAERMAGGAAAPGHAGWARIEGWAQDRRRPEVPVCLVVLAGERMLGRVLADRFRPDLARAGLGTGRHAFAARLAAPEGAIELRREADGALLAAALLRRAA
jgi:hypothetical protein